MMTDVHVPCCLPPGTLTLMLPDILHLCVLIGIVVTMMAMLSHLTYGYRVYHMSDLAQAVAFWMQSVLLGFDVRCVNCSRVRGLCLYLNGQDTHHVERQGVMLN